MCECGESRHCRSCGGCCEHEVGCRAVGRERSRSRRAAVQVKVLRWQGLAV